MYFFTKLFSRSSVTLGFVFVVLATSAQVAVDNFNPGPDNAVVTMALQPDGKIILGGIFLNVGGQGRSCIARLNPDGSLDSTFNPGAGGSFPEVVSLAVQPDGKILASGEFTTLAGTARNYIGRLNADGSIDSDFDPGANLGATSLILLTNGQILAAGAFSTIGGVSRPSLARLNTNGSVDTSFNAQVGGYIYTTAVQPDGKILIGGIFTNVGGVNQSYLARLNADGTLDSAFNPAPDSIVAAITVQTNGNILVGGSFTKLAGAARAGIGRLTANGAIDPAFNPGTSGGNPTNDVRTFALQTDGKIVVGGNFTSFAGKSQTFLGRLNSDGSWDSSFTISATPGGPGSGVSLGSSVYALAIQTNGEILVGGSFIGLGGQTRDFVGGLTNSSAALQNLALSSDGTTLTWSRSGSSPEVSLVTFETSPDGVTYSPLGYGLRISGGWQLGGLSIPPTQNVYLRARGQSFSGFGDSSVGIIQSVIQLYSTTAITQLINPGVLGNGTFQFAFTNANTNFSVLATTDPTQPLTNWTVLGPPTQTSPGYFQFIDTQASSYPARYYRVRSP